MKKIVLVLLISILLSTLYSCNNNDALPNATGKAWELVLVINKDKWKSNIGENFKSVFSKDMPGLPQSEPLFDVVNIPHAAYTDIFKTHRNVIITQIGPEIKEAKITIKENVWANPQVFISIVAPNDSLFNVLLNNQKDKIVSYIAKAERQRTIDNYSLYEEKLIGNNLSKKHNLRMIFPKGYNIDKDTNNFIWASYETSEISQAVLVYYYEYKNVNVFELSNLLKTRDSICKLYVPGPLPNTYMTTEKEIYPPELKEIMVDSVYTAEVRGLWRVENDYMGGPFVSLSRVDKKRNRVVTVEGYVYAPRGEKRNYVRQLEAILYSLKFE